MTDKKKAIAEISVDARLLHQRLKEVAVGETITWEELSTVIGRDVTAGSAGYGPLSTARKRALNDDGIVFDAVSKVGLKRLTDTEIVNTGQATVDKVRRAARKGAKRLLSVRDFEALPNAMKIKHNAYASLLGAVASIAQENKVHQLEKHVENAKAALPLAKTLEVFKS